MPPRSLCKVCVESNHPKPRSALNNDVCREHGAKKNLCKTCIDSGSKKTSEVKKDGYCVAHYRELVDSHYKACKICIAEKADPLGWIRSNGVCARHGGKVMYCTQCIADGSENPTPVRIKGLCRKHLGRIGKCTTCIAEDREICKWPVNDGLCNEHLGDDITYCSECLEENRTNPALAKQRGLCNKHGGYVYMCKICIEEGVESPNVSINNGVCRSHGAKRIYCKVCTEYDLPSPTLSKRNGLCALHGAYAPKCQECLPENILNPRSVIVDGKCKECSGIFICRIDDCNSTIFKDDYCHTHYIELNESPYPLCVNGCGYRVRKQKKCYNCFDEAEKEKFRKQERDKYHSNINLKLGKLLRGRLYQMVVAEYKKASALSLVGCSLQQLRDYLGTQFTEGMTWDNYGDWHIDHIKPCASFDLTCFVEQKKCFHYTNLQPLWAKDNMKKGARY